MKFLIGISLFLFFSQMCFAKKIMVGSICYLHKDMEAVQVNDSLFRFAVSVLGANTPEIKINNIRQKKGKIAGLNGTVLLFRPLVIYIDSLQHSVEHGTPHVADKYSLHLCKKQGGDFIVCSIHDISSANFNFEITNKKYNYLIIQTSKSRQSSVYNLRKMRLENY